MDYAYISPYPVIFTPTAMTMKVKFEKKLDYLDTSNNSVKTFILPLFKVSSIIHFRFIEQVFRFEYLINTTNLPIHFQVKKKKKIK